MADNNESTATPQTEGNPFAALAAMQPPQPAEAPPSAPATSENPFAAVLRAQTQPQPSTPAAAAPTPATTTPISQGGSNPFAALAAQSTASSPQMSDAEKQSLPKNTKADMLEERFGTGESMLSRPLTTYFGIPEYREGAGGVERGVEKTLSALTSPMSLGLLLATGGTSAIEEAGAAWLTEEGAAQAAKQGAKGFGAWALNWAEQNLGEGMAAKIATTAGAVDRISSLGFAYDQIRGIAAALPQIQSDLKAGDHDKALEHLTEAGIGAVFAAGMVSHLKSKFLGKEDFTYVHDKEAENELHGEQERASFVSRDVYNKARELNITPEENLGLRAWMEAGGAKGKLVPKESVRDLLPTNPFSEKEAQIQEKSIPDFGKAVVDIRHPEGSMELVKLDEDLSPSENGKIIQVKGIIGSKKGIGQRLYDTAIKHAVETGADEFRSDDVMTEDAKKAWQRLSNKYDVTRNSDGTYSINLNTLREERVPTEEYLRNQAARIQNMEHMPPNIKERELANIDAALNLRQEVKDFGTNVLSPEYSARWQSYKDAGLVHPDAVERENYAGSTRYEPEDETRSAYRPSESLRRATKNVTSLKPRSFPDRWEAMDKGYMPKNIGAIDAFQAYVKEHGGAIGIKKAEDLLLRRDDVDGRPVAINPSLIRFKDMETETGRTAKVPMVQIPDVSRLDPDTFQNKVMIDTDKDGNPRYWLNVSDYNEGPKVFSRNRVADVGFRKDPETGDVMVDEKGDPVEMPIMRKTALFFHPNQLDQVKNTFEDSSWIRKTPWANAILKTAQGSKSFLLALSPFHYVTEGLRGLQMGLNLKEVFHPAEIDRAGLAMNEGVNHGLTMNSSGEHSIYNQGAGEGVGATGPLFQKIPVLGNIQKVAEDHLFGSYIPRLKAMSFEKIAQDVKEQNPNWDMKQVYTVSARITNGIFGGLNWKQLGVSANSVDVLRMIALAPDFTGSQLDTTMSAFKPGGSVIAQSFGRMLMYNFLVAQTMNLLIHGQLHPEHPFSVVGPDEKRSWSMRTMPEDIWRSLTEPQSFFRNRLSPVTKTAFEMLYGRDDKGKKLNDEQMVGDAIRNTAPLSLQSAGSAVLHYFMPNVQNKFKTGSPEDHFYDSLLRSVGLNPSTNRTPAESLVSQRLADRMPAGTADPSQVERHHHVLDLEDQLRTGHSVDLTGLTPTQRRQVLTEGKKPMLTSKFDRLNMGDALDVWKVATSEERQQLLPDLLKKTRSYVHKLSPPERADDATYQRLVSIGLVKVPSVASAPPQEEPKQ